MAHVESIEQHFNGLICLVGVVSIISGCVVDAHCEGLKPFD